MKLRFGKLIGNNFQSFKNFTLNFGDIKNTTTLIMGENKDDEFASSNGAGKSATLEVISWVLFGTTFRSLRYTDEIINLQESFCDAILEFYLDDKQYTVFRSKAREKPTLLRLWEGDTELLKDSDSRSKQAQLESIMGFNFSTFTNSIMFHLDYVAFPELRPASRAEILTNVGNLEIYVKAVVQAKTETAKIDSDVATINIQISSLDKFIVQLGQENYDTKIQEWEKTNSEQLRELRRNLLELEKEHEEKREELKNNIKIIEQIIDDLTDDIDTKQEQYEVLSENLANEIEKNEDRNKQLIKEIAITTTEITTMKSEVTKYNKEIKDIKNLERGKCPTCQQNVTAEHADACVSLILKKLTDTQSQITEKNASYERLRASQTEVNDELNKYKQRRIEADAIKNKVSELNQNLVREQGNLKNLTNQLENFETIQTKRIQEKEKQLRERWELVNPYIEMKSAQERQIAEKQQEISDLKNQITELADERNYVSFYIDGFKKIKLMLFDDLVNRLNELSQEYLSRYTSELAVKVSCEKQTKTGTKDELHIEVERPEGIISYSAYSGGERQKIKLSVSLALAQLIEEMCDRDCDIIFFDEPNDGLDDIGKKSNFDIFTDLSTQEKTVIVIDHDAYFQDSFDNVITVIKENGYSRLEHVI